MKYNLKNFPIDKNLIKLLQGGIPNSFKTDPIAVAKWYLGFKEELLKIRKDGEFEWKGETRFINVVSISELLGEEE